MWCLRERGVGKGDGKRNKKRARERERESVCNQVLERAHTEFVALSCKQGCKLKGVSERSRVANN